MNIFQRRKEEGLANSRLEREAKEAWKESPKFQESQQEIKEERFKKLGIGAFAHRQSPRTEVPDDDKFPDDAEG